MAVEYRDVPWAEGYRVGDDGSVWSQRSRRRGTPGDWRQLKPVQMSNGYLQVQLGRGNQTAIHRLVLLVFVGPCPPGMLAAHRNGVRNDNRLENLRWATRRENEADKIDHGTKLIGESVPWAKLSRSDVLDIRRRCLAGECDSEIAKDFNVTRVALYLIRKRKCWAHV